MSGSKQQDFVIGASDIRAILHVPSTTAMSADESARVGHQKAFEGETVTVPDVVQQVSADDS